MSITELNILMKILRRLFRILLEIFRFCDYFGQLLNFKMVIKKEIHFVEIQSILTRARHLFGILFRPIIARIATTLREAVIGSFAVLWTWFTGMRACLVFELAYRTLFALLLVRVSLVARLAVASTRRKVPFSVSLAEESRLGDFDGVRHASAARLLDKRDLATGRRGREMGEVHRDLGTADVVHLDGQNRYAGALIAKGEVDALLRHRDRLHLGVYYHLGVRVEPALARGYAACKRVKY